ncbi:histone deacetylase 6 isoform X1 [Onthophagus taurus]|uniref:histone deacetylase 6 isoform X1 n=1 Tax=Onthophagus taurus TaxID=166361 RepID=UPI0039BEC5BB
MEGARKKESIGQMKARMRLAKKLEVVTVEDPFEKCDKISGLVRKRTGLTYDDNMALHECPWDEHYPENPLRYIRIFDRFVELDLINRCQQIPSEMITNDLVEVVHSKNTYEKLNKIMGLVEEDMQKEASKYDAIYFNDNTFEAACIAAGSVMNAVKSVCTGETQNAFALVRPPGHHAMFDEYCGYCYFNNVAIGAKVALKNGRAEKILIVDFDVHHGQATQQMFYDDDSVLYFSLHRYEHGTFWPNLRESNFDFIGGGKGKGYNVNVPLNCTGLEDKDYFAVIFNILLPIAYEFNPDLVLFSAGYDACIGCPEGEMKISPGFYGQLITLLGGLAQGRQVVCLEGGYFLESLAEGAAMSVKSLLDDAPGMVKPFGKPEEHIIDVINNLRFILQPFWKCFESFPQRNECVNDPHRVMVKYLGVRLTAPFLTHDCYPVQCEFINEQFAEVVDEYRKEYSEPTGNGICYAFDEVMFEHKTPENFPERPERLIKLYEKFTELKLHERLIKVSTRKATEDELLLIHDKEYIDSLINSKLYTATRDVYFTPESLPPILTSAGCLLNVVDQVMTNKSRAGVAMIRPPGHHAEKHQPMGFCFINNIALAAKYILTKYKTKRILILDFDVHHGNGTQKAFYNSKEVLYISVHQYNNGNFFPNGSDGNFNMHGEGRGVGYNVNIPFNKENPSDFMTDTEYITIFNHIILPISYSFGPEVILVSAGFDAGLDDPIGHYRVTPEAFGHFIQLLKPLARGKMILSLEGGYNVNTVAYSMTMCIKALLGDPLPSLEIGKIRKSALETLEKVINVQKRFWPILQVRKELPEGVESLTLLGPEGLIVIDSPDIEMLQKIGVNDD